LADLRQDDGSDSLANRKTDTKAGGESMKLKNIRITYEPTSETAKAGFWYSHTTDDGGTENQPYGFVTKIDLMELKQEIDRVLATKIRMDKERIRREIP
jgi:hypothetical protein